MGRSALNDSRIFTIGHAAHDTVESLIALLIPRVVTVLIDVRWDAYIRHFPRFNRPVLEAIANRECIYYLHIGDVGGDIFADRLGVVSDEEIASSERFERAISRIAETAQRQRVVLMGVEEDPLRCRRAVLYAQALDRMGFDLRHLSQDGDLESHRQLEDRLLLAHDLADPFFLMGESQLSLLDQRLTVEAQRTERLLKAYRLQRRAIAHLESHF